jgi:hypothetical protein
MLDALERLDGTGVEFAGFLANHGPMAADAMIRLGGGEMVGRWIEQYRPELEPAAPGGNAVTSDNWREHLGRPERVGDWSAYFDRAIAGLGWVAVLQTWWERLIRGAAASATHGLIRTAHAVRNLAELHNEDPLLLLELANGLGFWAARYQALPGQPGLRGRCGLAESLARLPRLETSVRSAGPGIGGRLASLGTLDALPAALDRWDAPPDPAAALDELISAAARVLIAREDAPIAYCHAVTAPAAVRMILPSIPAHQLDATVAACWQVVGSIVAAFAAPPDPPARDRFDPPVAADVASSALEHGDEHVMKLAEACLRQFAVSGDPALLVAAHTFRPRIRRRW